MIGLPNRLVGMLVFFFLFGFTGSSHAADSEVIQTPSQKTKEAVEKFHQAPTQLGKGLDALKEAGRAVLQETFGGKKSTDTKESGELTVPEKRAKRPATARFSPVGKRDPFRPLSLRTREGPRRRDNLSPLERYELGQLKIVGIVWDIEEPKAMVEDTAGLGYIVTVGTAIGASEGRVKAIKPNEIIIEETYSDFYGVKKRREVSMKLSPQ